MMEYGLGHGMMGYGNYYGYGGGMMKYGNYFGYGHGMLGYGINRYGLIGNGGGWIMVLGMVILIAAVVFVAVKLVKLSEARNPAAEAGAAVRIVDERYARGEISEEEYIRIKQGLRI